jgi:predicted Rossmann fold flavoprotein
MLFTHKGLSGPACLQISSYWKKGDKVKINLLPKVDAQEWLMGLKNKASKDTIKKALINQISRKLAVNFVDAFADSKIKDLPLVEIKNSDLNKFGNLLNNWYVNPTSTEGIKKAEVCIGGVDTNELNPKTMESRKHKGLYFIGEVVDVTGHLGGYNFQWAWSSGFVLGNHILQP